MLANIALSELDEHFEQQWREQMGTRSRRETRRRKGLGTWRLIRYADDFVVMVSGGRHHVETLRAEVASVLAPMGLRLSPEKTRIVHIDEGFDFLGFHIRRQRKRGTQKHYVYTVPSKRAVKAIKDKVRRRTYRSTRTMDLSEVITILNQTLRGWANYFRHGVSKRTFGHIDEHAWWRLVGWIRAKYSRISVKEVRRRFCDYGWTITHAGVEFTGASSVAVTRYRYRGRSIPTPWTPSPAAPNS